MVIKLAHYGLSTCFIEVTTSTIMKTVMKWVIIVVIIVSSIDTALVDSVCICHLRKGEAANPLTFLRYSTN